MTFRLTERSFWMRILPVCQGRTISFEKDPAGSFRLAQIGSGGEQGAVKVRSYWKFAFGQTNGGFKGPLQRNRVVFLQGQGPTFYASRHAHGRIAVARSVWIRVARFIQEHVLVVGQRRLLPIVQRDRCAGPG